MNPPSPPLAKGGFLMIKGRIRYSNHLELFCSEIEHGILSSLLRFLVCHSRLDPESSWDFRTGNRNSWIPAGVYPVPETGQE